jgi:capsular polysaccharide export protein
MADFDPADRPAFGSPDTSGSPQFAADGTCGDGPARAKGRRMAAGQALNRLVKRPFRREFLFLQGLAGPFFSLLGERLAAHGHGIHRVNFNGGDKIYWRLPHAIDYRRGLKHWPRFISQLIESRRITDLVLFGDCRPLHSAAIDVARAAGIQIHVFEEGYIRPDFVTVELGGVNGHSGLHRDPDAYLDAARSLPPMPQFEGVPSYFSRRAREDLVYNFSSVALWALFPGYRTHRPWNILVEYVGWAKRLVRKAAALRRSERTLAALRADGRPFFTFPLQLTDDYQIRVHSPFGGMQPAIAEVFQSFAKYAPADTLLLVKGHPLDNGLTDWQKKVEREADRFGIADRVRFTEWGDIDLIVRESVGVVTVNSTTGTLSLLHGVPTIVLGHAIYDIPRITHQGGLNTFWGAPVAPEREVFDAFRRVLIDRCLIHGGYFSDEGLEMLVSGAAERLETSETVVPLPTVRPLSARIDKGIDKSVELAIDRSVALAKVASAAGG